ncbi:MAG: TylF/MycF/NovP-related O-methyltransferase, partial [Gammaproteobacteria bacterium]|nr:TylF/MycF/NovP-related O-methyltransferase [Gammaproteobacteria bacterium]
MSNRNDRYGALIRAWGYVFSNHLSGDYVEFGVYQGLSVKLSMDAYKNFSSWLKSQHSSSDKWRNDVAKSSPLNKLPTFHCLDTFSGMPENDEQNYSFKKGSYHGELEQVKKFLNKYNSLGINIEYYKGLFCDTGQTLQNNLGDKKIAIAHLDCDLLSSTKDSLDIIHNNLQIGSILLFDDYNCFNAHKQKGQRKAFDDFQKTSSFVFEPLFSYFFTGMAFVAVD